ncbi:hypothetical protein LJC25_03655 [Bacteroidales bacterium OttesenSCG-928-K03]|nr:hypothetical protein [Odoribacter sp. OttesenSCG-928-L07]MDL2239287.1 hypothetical protein [Bacteroidales bacterium OttesenSCG-928-L14]MDL2240674.1 hypothetical protein [Bacteroidales bacterium OttesenSCG-928-K22]MDL2242807.1 hypothetical protein [Bacteroidales bacterium OttesenSCG-928-K03]
MQTNLLIKSGLFLLSFLIMQSCITITGVTDDYNKTTENQKKIIHYFEEDVDLVDGNIYRINAMQLKNEMAKYPKSLVYVFTNGCTASNCFPMRTYIDYAEKHDYKLFIVMNGFGNVKETLVQYAPIPYYVINSEYYGTNKREKYEVKFLSELINKELTRKEKQELGTLFIFEGEKFIRAERILPEDESVIKFNTLK